MFLIFVAFIALFPVLDAFTCLIGVNITMRDGVDLFTCIDFPIENPSKWIDLDLVIDRSPYGAFNTEMIADLYLLEGYVAVRQDQRGTHNSGGVFSLWNNAADDNFDTMQWLATQPWASGTMFAVGASADGIAVFDDPKDAPPWLKAVTLIFSTCNGYDIIFPGGAYRKSLTEFWLNKTVPFDYANLLELVKSNEAPSSFWNRINSTGDTRAVVYPSVMWAGWYDIFLRGHLQGFDLYQHHSPSAGSHRLIIDPLGHCQAAAKYFPYHLLMGRSLLPILLSMQLFAPDAHLVPASVHAVTFYVMGAWGEGPSASGNYWTSLHDFPTFAETPFFLQAEGRLARSRASGAYGVDSFDFDPLHPVPSMGGSNLEIPCGPLDQQSVEQRPDVLLYTSEPLSAPLAITGPLAVRLFVRSNVTDTDFTAKLTDVYPSGQSVLLQDGIIRMRWRHLPSPQPVPMVPEQIYEVTINLWNTSFVFERGHRIRVAVSSSNYPRYEANPNNGCSLLSSCVPQVARNSVLFGPEYPSALLLPVVPLEALPAVDLDLHIKPWLTMRGPAYQRRVKHILANYADRLTEFNNRHDLSYHQHANVHDARVGLSAHVNDISEQQ